MSDKEMSPSAFDLTALSEYLHRRSLAPDLISAITRATSVGSAYQDLSAARDAVDALEQRLKDEEAGLIDTSRGVVAAALFAHSIILYARSTDTKPIDRWKWFGSQQLTNREKQWHKELIDYRDKVLAHFGTGKHHSVGASIEHSLILRVPEKTNSPIHIDYVELRSNTKAVFLRNLSHLVKKCLILSKKRYLERIEEVSRELQKLIREEPDVAILAKKYPFNSDLVNNAMDETEFDANGYKTIHYAVRKLVPKQEE